MKYNYTLLSHILSEETPTYGNRDKLSIKFNSSIVQGATANSYSINFSTNHMGTHIDFPYHFYKNGKSIIDINNNYWFFKNIEVVDIPCKNGQIIEVKDLLQFDLSNDMDILLIRTGFEKYRDTDIYWKNNPGISPEVSTFLKQKYLKLRTIGFDFISLTSFENRALGKEAHLAFLDEKNSFISIIEDMKLAKCPKKIDELYVAPILISKIDSSPVTVLGRYEEKNG